MIREERTVFLTVLTFVVYASLQWLEKGSFLFPFPLNEIVIFGIFCYFLIINKSSRTKLSFFLGLVLFFKMVSQQFFWTLFLTNDSLEILYSSLWTDGFYLCYGLSFILFSYYFLSKKEGGNFWLVFTFCILVFLVGIVINQPMLELISFIFLIILGYRFNINRIVQAQLVLVSVFEIGKQLMLIY